MDNDDKTIGRIYSRREALQRLGGVGFAAVIGGRLELAASQQGQAQDDFYKKFMVATPELTEGPFFNDDGIMRSNLLEGTTRSSVVDGYPLELRIRIWELSGQSARPLKGAKVDVWHCDAIGVYSGETNGGRGQNTVGQNWLRGFLITDKSGLTVFKTIWPGWYPGRTIHIHFKIRLLVNGQTYDFTSQWFFDDAMSDQIMLLAPYSQYPNRSTRNSNDGIYRTPQAAGGVAGDRLLLRISDNPLGGKIGEFDVAFDSDGL